MMDMSKFKKAMSRLVTIKNIEINKAMNDALYELMQDDFTDEEFEGLCVYIVKHENLYNKYPDPTLFYKHKQKKPSPKQIEDARVMSEFVEFFDELVENLTSRCSAYSGVGLNGLQKRTLQAFGGFNDLWRSVNRDDGYARSISSLKRDMQQFYLDNYRNDQILQIADKYFTSVIVDITKKIAGGN